MRYLNAVLHIENTFFPGGDTGPSCFSHFQIGQVVVLDYKETFWTNAIKTAIILK